MGIKIQNPYKESDSTISRSNKIWAKSPIELTKRENEIILTSNHLIITKNSKEQVKLPLMSIDQVSFQKKKLLLPFIAGSVLTPLTAIAFYQDLINPVPFLALFLTGVFLLYVGLKGAHALIINDKSQMYKRFVFDPAPALTSFLHFSRIFIHESKSNDGKLVFLSGDKTERGIRLFFRSQKAELKARTKSATSVKTVDPMKLTQPIQIIAIEGSGFEIFTSEIAENSILQEIPLESFD